MSDIRYITKANIGDMIHCIPIYNAAQRGVPLLEQIREFKLIRLTEEKFTIEFDKFGVNKREVHQFHRLDKNNRGYIPFASKKLAIKYLHHTAYLNKLIKNANVSILTLEQIDKIIAITGMFDD